MSQAGFCAWAQPICVGDCREGLRRLGFGQGRVGRELYGGRELVAVCVPRLRMPPQPQGSGQTVQVPPGDERG